MKYVRYTIILTIALITSFCICNYIERVSFDYNTQGRFFSLEDGAVYHEQTKEVFGVLTLLGVFTTGILIYKQFRK